MRDGGKTVCQQLTIHVECTWDPESRVWTAESNDLPGLVTEASTVEALLQRVMDVAPDLVQENLIDGPAGSEVSH